MDRKGSIVIRTILIGLFLIIVAAAIFLLINSGDSEGPIELTVIPIGQNLFSDTFSDGITTISRLGGISSSGSGSSGSSSGSGSGSGTGSGNNAPIANAGVDQTVNEGVLVTLDGSSSVDADGDPLTFTWTQTSGPAVTLSNANAVSPTFTSPSVTSNTALTFQLTVSDGSATGIDLIDVNVNDIPVGSNAPFWINVANTVNAGVDPSANTIIYPTLTDQASDLDVSTGDVLTFSVETTHVYTLTFDANGNLRIGDTNGYFGTDTVTIRATDSSGLFADVSFQLNVKTEICLLDDCFIYG